MRYFSLSKKFKNKILSLPSCSAPLVSIIIPVHNKFYYTLQCLQSIFDTSKGIDYEIILADDASTDETINISHCVNNLKIVRNEKNLGFINNCNNAAKTAIGKYILFLNNDTKVKTNWLKYLLDAAKNDSSIGLIGSKLIFSNGKLQEAGGIVWNNADSLNYGRFDNPEKQEYNYLRECDYVSGASMMIRRNLFNKIGGFDSRYCPAYYEDTDLAFEVRKTGYKVVFQPFSEVVHYEKISHGNKSGKKYKASNRNKFYEKWKEILTKEHFEVNKHSFAARDRSKNKKTIVILVNELLSPVSGRDDLKLSSHTDFLLKKGFNVKLILIKYYPVNHCYIRRLQTKGIEVIWYSYFVRKKIIKLISTNKRYIDYIILDKQKIPDNYLDFIKKRTRINVVKIDNGLHDLLFYD